MLKKVARWKWIIAAIVCFILVNALPETFIEHYYSRGFFRLIRKLFDVSLGNLPFPSYYIFAVIILLFAVTWILHFFTEKPEPLLQRMFNILSFTGFMITLFFILWGFNYGRIPVENTLQMNIRPLTQQQLADETKETIANLAEIRIKIKKDTTTIPEIIFINNIEDNSRRSLNQCLTSFQYDTSHVRGRFIFEDALLVFNIGGQYLPYVGEGNVDDAVFYSKKPFYVIHEMAHGNGFTEEADCNFLAYVSCVQSGNIPLRYSGELNYLLYLLSELHTRDETTYKIIWDSMPRAVQKDLIQLREYMVKHTFKSGILGEAINNLYLKMMGVKDGTKNYDKMILLIYAWKNNKI